MNILQVVVRFVLVGIRIICSYGLSIAGYSMGCVYLCISKCRGMTLGLEALGPSSLTISCLQSNLKM